MFDFSGLKRDIPLQFRVITATVDLMELYREKDRRYYRIEVDRKTFVLSERKLQYGDWHFMLSSDDLHRILMLLGWKTKPKEKQ